jgi:hypothetical protein
LSAPACRTSSSSSAWSLERVDDDLVRGPAGRGRLGVHPRQEAIMADESHGDFAAGERTTPKGPERDFAEGEEQAPPGTKRDFAEGEENDAPGHERDFAEGQEKPSD